MTRNTVILHREWCSFLDFLSDEELGIWLRGILDLMQTGEPPKNLSRPVEIAFYAAYERIDRDWQKLDKRMANLNHQHPKQSEPAAPAPAPEPQTALLDKMVEQCSAVFSPPPKNLRQELARALARFGPELTLAILQNCLSHQPKSWSYLRRAFLNAAQLGLANVQDYQTSCLRASNQIVDRPTPSSNDILARALHRPLALKRSA